MLGYIEIIGDLIDTKKIKDKEVNWKQSQPNEIRANAGARIIERSKDPNYRHYIIVGEEGQQPVELIHMYKPKILGSKAHDNISSVSLSRKKIVLNMSILTKFSIFRKNKKQCFNCPYILQYYDTVLELSQKWNDITNCTAVPLSGKYILACKGDNRMLYEIHDYLVGELFVDYYHSKFDGFQTIKPVKYLYLPELDESI